MNLEKQRLINADELKKEIIRMANRSSLGEISTNTDLPLGAVLSLIDDSPTALYRKVVKNDKIKASVSVIPRQRQGGA